MSSTTFKPKPFAQAMAHCLVLGWCISLSGLSACSRGLTVSGTKGKESNLDGGLEILEDGGISAEAGPTLGSTRVAGRVVAMDWGRGAAGRKVVIGGKSVITNADGSFSFDEVPSTYDAVVVEPDGALVSIYYGLTRRDPILSHSASYDPILDDPPNRASVVGSLTGDFPFPLDGNHVVTAYYLSDRVRASLQLSNLPAMSPGPDYGPFTLRWAGDASVDGTLVVIGQYGVNGTPWLGAFLASKALTLSDGDAVVENLVLTSVHNGNISGSVQMYDGNAIDAIQFSYSLGNAMGLMGLGEFPSTGRFDCALPDLSALGGDYCATIVAAWGEVQATRCGGQIGMLDFSIHVQAPPQIQKPTDGSPITKESKLSWTGVTNAVYLLDIIPDSATSTVPRIQAYLSGTQLAWPDLKSLGVEFPVGQTYGYRVSGFVPYASMDAFASSEGPYRTGVDLQQLDSKAISLVLIR